MNIYLLLLFIPPILICVVMKYRFHETITWYEMALQFTVPLVLIAIVWNVSKYSQMADTQILNGHVTDKKQVWTSCSHSYSCNCRTVSSGSGKNRSTYTKCDTCYEHVNDWDWTVYSTVGNFDIDRIDRRGSHEPPRWTKVRLGDPVAVRSPYINYIKAAPDSLFHAVKAKQYKGIIPNYPSVYDYQYADRVIPVEMDVPHLDVWNDTLARALISIGENKQGNVVLVFTKKSPVFAEALETKWVGGKKNDILIVVGTHYPRIDWVRVYSWSKHDIVNIALRNGLLESKILDPHKTVGIISTTVLQYYERKPMADFAYLEDEIVPSTWVIILSFILGLSSSIGIGIFCHREDIFG